MRGHNLTIVYFQSSFYGLRQAELICCLNGYGLFVSGVTCFICRPVFILYYPFDIGNSFNDIKIQFLSGSKPVTGTVRVT